MSSPGLDRLEKQAGIKAVLSCRRVALQVLAQLLAVATRSYCRASIGSPGEKTGTK